MSELLEQAAPGPSRPLPVHELVRVARGRRRSPWLALLGVVGAVGAALSPASPLPSLVGGSRAESVLKTEERPGPAPVDSADGASVATGSGMNLPPRPASGSAVRDPVPASAGRPAAEPGATRPNRPTSSPPPADDTTANSRDWCEAGAKYNRMSCTFVATAPGSYAGGGPAWHVRIHRGETVIDRNGATDSWCSEVGFIQIGDRVEVWVDEPVDFPPPPSGRTWQGAPNSYVRAGRGSWCT